MTAEPKPRKRIASGRRRKGEMLSRLHRRVIDEYMIDFNETAALERAGYAKPVRHRTASGVFALPQVQAEIARRQKKAAKTARITRDQIIEALAAMAGVGGDGVERFMKTTENGDLYWDFRGAVPEQLKQIEGLTVEEYVEGRGDNARVVKRIKIARADRIRAIAELNKMLGFNAPEKVEVSGNVSIVERLQAARKWKKANG